MKQCDRCNAGKHQNREKVMEQLHSYLELNGTPPETDSLLGSRIRNVFNMSPYGLSIIDEFQNFKGGN